MIKNPYTADNVIYATLIEQLDQEIAEARVIVERTFDRFMQSLANAHWTRHVTARADLARLIRQVRVCERDQRACMPKSEGGPS